MRFSNWKRCMRRRNNRRRLQTREARNGRIVRPSGGLEREAGQLCERCDGLDNTWLRAGTDPREGSPTDGNWRTLRGCFIAAFREKGNVVLIVAGLSLKNLQPCTRPCRWACSCRAGRTRPRCCSSPGPNLCQRLSHSLREATTAACWPGVWAVVSTRNLTVKLPLE